MFSLVIIGILVLVAIVSFVLAALRKIGKVGFAVGGGAIIVGLVVLFFSSFYTNGVGEAKVKVNFDGTVAGSVIDQGAGFKAPWQHFVNFDTFSQTATYAGSDQGAPKYTGGDVQGAEVTAAVKGGAQSNADISVTYNLDPKKVVDIYRQFKTQQNFTAQVINNRILNDYRDIPSNYSAIDFRGDKKGEAQDRLLKALNKDLDRYGVTVNLANIQNITYTSQVEDAIKGVLVAQQKQATAEAELQATKVSSQQAVVQAEATAKANDILTKSLSPQVLQQHYIDAIGKSGTVYVVPQGSTPVVGAIK